jgi:outer membrane protein assembly factor BamE (lipoprotein component of BamABCDE complex)
MSKFVLAGCIAVLVLSGCAAGSGREGVRQYWTLNERDIAGIARGNTKGDVERALGKPILVETFRNLREEVWNYRFLERSVGRFGAEVHFDMEGRTTSVVTFPDECMPSQVPCR